MSAAGLNGLAGMAESPPAADWLAALNADAPPGPAAGVGDADRCAHCGCREYQFGTSSGGDAGARICTACGCVQGGVNIWETRYGLRVPLKGSNYKRIHHWHERIAQFQQNETAISDEHLLAIGRRLLDGSIEYINKDTVRAVLRSLNMQLYIEKWMQVVFRVLRTLNLTNFTTHPPFFLCNVGHHWSPIWVLNPV